MTDLNQHLDLDVVEELRIVMGDDLQRLVDTFLGDSEQRLDAIQAAIGAGDAEALRRGAHSFKGSAGNMGAYVLAGLCQQLELLGREGRVEGAPALLDAARGEYRQVGMALSAFIVAE